MPSVSQHSIERLHPRLASRLRSQTAVTGLARIVEELVCNSIDAQASEIVVELDAGLSQVRAQDNGTGIRQENFSLLAEKACSSKLKSGQSLSVADTLGFKGEALASIADSSTLEITSRAAGSFETHAKLLRGGAVLKQGLALEQWRHQGTVISVREFLFNQPVRRRQLIQTG